MRVLWSSLPFMIAALLGTGSPAAAREFQSQVSELDHIPAMRGDFPVPRDPNMLFYVERSVNANTVVYAAHLDPSGRIDPASPVDVYWRWTMSTATASRSTSSNGSSPMA